ncbi:MAG TPA: hypothetical protein VNI01_10050 [Elusimicrobiota bacterium]|nr:hypothetical protein [Elusimicrobiota bacterium]
MALMALAVRQHGGPRGARSVRGGGEETLVLHAADQAMALLRETPQVPPGVSGGARRAAREPRTVSVREPRSIPECSRVRERFSTWKALLSDPAALKEHLADCEAVWGGVQLDWSGVFAEIGPAVADGTREYGGRIDVEPGRPWRLKIVQLEAGHVTKPGELPHISVDISDKYRPRPALFCFHTHPTIGEFLAPVPSAMDLASATIDAFSTCTAADVVLSGCGAAIYGPGRLFRRRVYGPGLVAEPSSDQLYRTFRAARDILMVVSATGSCRPIYLRDFGRVIRDYDQVFDFVPNGLLPGHPCWRAWVNQDPHPNIRAVLDGLAKNIAQAKKTALSCKETSSDEKTSA